MTLQLQAFPSLDGILHTQPPSPWKNSQGFLPPLDLVFTSSQSWFSLGAFPCPRAAEGMQHLAAALPVTPARSRDGVPRGTRRD